MEKGGGKNKRGDWSTRDKSMERFILFVFREIEGEFEHLSWRNVWDIVFDSKIRERICNH